MQRLNGTADEFVFAAPEGTHYRKRLTSLRARLIKFTEGGESDHKLVWLTTKEAVSKLAHKSQTWAIQKDKPIDTAAKP